MAVNTGTVYSDVRVRLDALKGDISAIQREYDKLGKGIGDSTGKAEQTATKNFQAINLAGIAAMTGLTLAIRGAVTAFAGFEQSLANVRSVAAATPQEFQELEDAARNAGETTRFTASQAADALYALASAGLSATESAAALDGVLSLAAATQSDLAFTSQTVTAALAQFSLDADQSADVANVFAAAIANSQATMEKMAAAMRMVGPVAGTLGISLEETTGALQALFNAGFRGEQAGTALRSVLSQLADTAGPAAQKLTDLGVNMDAINPATNNLTDVIGALADAGLTAGEAINVFGTEAGPGLLTLLNAGRDGMQEYTDAVTGTDAAAEAAEIQIDTLQGDLDELSSIAESTGISFSEEFAPAIRGVVDMLTDLLKFVNSLPGPLKIFFGILATGITVVAGLQSALSVLGITASIALGPVAAVIAGGAAIAAGISAIGSARNQRVMETVVERLRESATQGKGMADSIADFSRETGASIDAVIEVADSHGLITEEIREQLAMLREENEELENGTNSLSDSLDIQRRISESLRTTLGHTLDARVRFEEIATATGVTAEQVLRIADSTEGLTEEQKLLVEEVRSQLQEEQRILSIQEEMHRQQVEYTRARLDANQIIQQNIEDSLRRTADAVAAAAEAERVEQLRVAEGYDQNGARRIAADERYRDSIRATNTLLRQGYITEAEATEAQISANDQLIQTLANIGYHGNLVTETWTTVRNGVAETVTGIQIGNIQLAEAIARIAQLREEQAEALGDLSSGFDKAGKIGDKLVETGKSNNEQLTSMNELSAEYVDIMGDYSRRIQELISGEQDLRQAEIETVRERLEAAGASEEAIQVVIDKINEYYDLLENEEAYDEQMRNLQDFANAAVAAFTQIGDSAKSIISSQLDAELAALDQELRARLEAEGLAEETKIERLQREMNEAIAQGNEELAEEKRIQLERAKLVEEYEKKKAQAEYKAAMSSWRINLLQAIANAAMVTLNGFMTQPFLPAGLIAGGLALATGAVQVAAVREAKPSPPTFHGGGIVPGNFRQEVPVVAQAGEGVFTPEQMQALGLMIQEKRGGGSNMPNSLTIDLGGGQRVFSELVVEDIDNGQVRLKALDARRV